MEPESVFQIRGHRLDEDWLSQPDTVYEYCTRLADAKKLLNEAKSDLEVVEAETDRDVRLHPSRFGIDKLSENRVKNAVILTPQYKKANKEVIHRQHEVDVLQAAVTALEHKKRALENLVHLHSMSYFSKPRTNEDSYESMREEQRARVLNKRKKEK